MKLSEQIESHNGQEYGYEGGHFYFPDWLIEGVAQLEDENERLRKLINKYHLGIIKVDDGQEINLGSES